jgi:Abnormal spindle-like microcephaly-assoc'd, ASPM-SPD-2-Hydin/Beta-propeller repeat
MSVKPYLACVFGLCGIASLLVALNQPPKHENPSARSKARASDGRRSAAPRRAPSAYAIPITFEPNVGQANAQVQFVGRGKGMTVLLTSAGVSLEAGLGAQGETSAGGVTMRLVSDQARPRRRRHSRRQHRKPASRRRRHKNTGEKLEWKGREELRAQSNYFLGNDPVKWRTRVPHFGRVEAAELQPGVDCVFYGNEEGIEYDLRIAPHVNIRDLHLEISGAHDLRMDAEGNLLVVTNGNEIRMQRPAIYEELPDGGRRRLKGEYDIDANGAVGFVAGSHDPDATLVVDPSLSIAYSTFLGGTGTDTAASMAVDSLGKIYIGGTTTSSSSFPETIGTNIGTARGLVDLFVAKIDPTVNGAGSLVYLTFVGGSGSQTGGLIAVDNSGDVAITGTTTSTDYPVTDGSSRTAGTNDAIVTEIGPTGGSLVYSTLFGGSGAESAQNAGGIALNSSGNIFIASDTNSADLPVTAGAFQPTFGGGVSDGYLAIFVPGAISPTPHLEYCTYFGIDAQVGVGGVAVDSLANAFIAGYTSNPGTSFPVQGALQSVYGGDPYDGFLLKIIPSGMGAADLSYATFLGGSGLDQALAVQVGTGQPATAYVTGTTQSNSFPTAGTVAAYQSSLKGSANAFLSVVAQDATTGATSLVYSTYLGGTELDTGLGLFVRETNAVYVTGGTTSWNFPWLDNFQPFNGNQDAFLAKLDPTSPGSASLIYATPLGGTALGVSATAVAQANGVVVDASGNVYLAGTTTAGDFPTAGAATNGFQETCTSCTQSPPQSGAFLVEISEQTTQSPCVSFSGLSVNFGAQSLGGQNIPPLPAAVINTGDASLIITSVGIAGQNSSQFSLSNVNSCTASPISPGGNCQVLVTFDPTVVGPLGANINVVDNATGSPQVLAVAGIGSGALGIMSSPALNFGNQPQGTVASQTVNLLNEGNQPLQITNLALGGPGIAQFFLQPECTVSSPLAAGSSCTFNITFAPKATGTFQAEIDIVDNSGNVPGTEQVIPLAGTGTPPAPIANILPTSFVFGTQTVGTASGAQTVTLTNQGSAVLNMSGIGLTGGDNASFDIVPMGTNPCPIMGGTVPIGGTCTVAVNFAPLSSGAKSASLTFNDNAAGSPQIVAFSGTGIAPVAQISTGSLTFAQETVGTTSTAQNVTLSNPGNAPLTIISITMTGADPSDFIETNHCSSNVGANGSCVLNISFTPTGVGNRTAILSISDNAIGSPQTVTLTGTAVQTAASLEPTSFNFPLVQLAQTPSQPTPITVMNNGTGVLAITGISFAGANPGDFSETDTCHGNIGASATCSIQVTFKPMAAGARSATLTVADNGSNSPQSVALSGTAMDFVILPTIPGGVALTVAAGNPATYSLEVNSLNGFAGSISLTCTGAPDGCAIPATLSVTANSSTAFQVTAPTIASSLMTPTNPGGTGGMSDNLRLRIIVFIAILFAWDVRDLLQSLPGTQRFARSVSFGAILGLLALAACSANGGGAAPANSGTSSGTSTLTINATTGTGPGATNRILNLTLTVQNPSN